MSISAKPDLPARRGGACSRLHHRTCATLLPLCPRSSRPVVDFAPPTSADRRMDLLEPGLTISAKFRRNFGKFFVSASYRDSKFRYFSVYFVFKFKIQQISTEIQRNSPKFTEISEQNSVSAKHRDLTGKRNG